MLAFSRAFRLFSPTLKSLLVRQVLLKLRQKLPLTLFLFVPIQVYHLYLHILVLFNFSPIVEYVHWVFVLYVGLAFS